MDTLGLPLGWSDCLEMSDFDDLACLRLSSGDDRHYVYLTRGGASELRKWLSEWLGDDSPVTATAADAKPDLYIEVRPFRHPYIAGTDRCPKCEHTWHDHGWIDKGDHGYTVCPWEWADPDAELVELISDALAGECGEFNCGFDHEKHAAVLLRELREVADVTPKAVMGDE